MMPVAESVSATTTVRRSIARLRIAIEIALWRHGWLWIVAAALWVAVACMAMMIRIQSDTADTRHALQGLEDASPDGRGGLRTAGSSAKPDVGGQPAANLDSVLVARDRSGDEVRRIYEIADQQQVPISQAGFQSEVDPAGIERLQITIPTTAGYPQLRHFLELCLLALPNLSLDRFRVGRSQVGSAQVEVQLHLSLWLRAPRASADRPATTDSSGGARP
jgi:hypothetical protein